MLQYRNLGNTGMKISSLSIGGALYGNVYGKFDKKSAIEGLHFGLDSGINYIDTAPWYGQGKSEKFLGDALKNISREKYYIGTKVGRYEKAIPLMFDFSAQKTISSAESSLQNLGLDYVDILQVHDVEFAPSVDIILNETLPAIEELKKRGLCKRIGITGYVLSVLNEVVKKSSVKIDSVLSYGRLTLIDTSLVQNFDFFCSKNIGIINASPMAMGLLSSEFKLQEWHPSQAEIRVAASEAIKFCNQEGVDISRIAMRFSSSFEEVSTTITGMLEKDIISSNIDAVSRPLNDKELEVQKELRKIFSNLNVCHWEGLEVANYWSSMKHSKKDA